MRFGITAQRIQTPPPRGQTTSIEKEKTMSLKHLIASTVLALTVAGGLAAHASPSTANAAAATCQTTVLEQVPVTGHQTTHGYLYLMRDLCDGNIFLRESTDLWGSYVTEKLTTPTGSVVSSANLTWGGHVDTAEVPYTSGVTYSFYGYVSGFWGDTYYGGALYTAP
jgi:hypothetical protein